MSQQIRFVLIMIIAGSMLTLLAAFAPPATVGATVKSVSADGTQITVVVGGGKSGKEQVFRLTGATKITLDGKPVPLSELKDGTKVTLSYDKTSQEAVSIRVTSAKPENPPEEPSPTAPAKSSKKSETGKAPPVGAPVSSSPGEWPQWRGPERNGVSKDAGLLKQWPESGPPLVWRVSGLGSGFSSVAVTGGRIFTTGDRGQDQYVVCLNAADGKEVWSTAIGKPGNGARSTPTVDGELLYALSTRGQQEAEIVCLETATGKERWRKNFQKDFGGRMQQSWGYSESPLVDGDNVICTPGGPDAALVALKKKTGDIVWKAKVSGGDAAAYSSAVVAEVGGIRQYVQLLEKGIVGVAAKDGRFLWRYNKIANGTANIPTPVVRGDLVFCSTGYNTGAALLKLAPSGGGIKFEEKYFLPATEFQNHHGGMVLVGDHVYAGSGHNNGLPTCIDLKTGKIVWGKQRGPGTHSAAVVYADGNLYFRYENAVMALIEATPKAYTVSGTFNIPNGSTPSWSHPVVAGGRLYLRDQDRLLCYDVRADATTARASASR